MSSFNLIDEKWIPVVFLDGTRGELGIRDTFSRAKEIAGIENQSPLVVAALHRFLLAVLYRALQGPTDMDQAKAIFKSGLPQDKIDAYLKKWHDRFWLFDEKYPFGQNPNVAAEEIEPWTKLTAEYNATSNKVLFDHTDTKKLKGRTPAECACWLIATMNFSISGGRGYYPSPSPNAIMCIPLGNSLFDTLGYSLVPYPNRKVMELDSALWERDPITLPLAVPKRISSGYADTYTWQSRMVLLNEKDGVVENVRFAAGPGFENSAKTPDPMQAYRVDKAKGILPKQFREDRGVWRDFDSLLPDDSGALSPLALQNAFTLAGNNISKMPKSVLLLGLRYDPPNANLTLWRMEHFVLPPILVGKCFVKTEIHQLLEIVEHTQSSLWMACSSFARAVLSRGEKRPDNNDVKKFIKQIPAIPAYWSILESRFHEILGAFAAGTDADIIRCRWLTYVRDALKTVWEQYAASIDSGDAWAIRALVKEAERPVLKKLKELSAEIEKYQKQEVS